MPSAVSWRFHKSVTLQSLDKYEPPSRGNVAFQGLLDQIDQSSGTSWYRGGQMLEEVIFYFNV